MWIELDHLGFKQRDLEIMSDIIYTGTTNMSCKSRQMKTSHSSKTPTPTFFFFLHVHCMVLSFLKKYGFIHREGKIYFTFQAYFCSPSVHTITLKIYSFCQDTKCSSKENEMQTWTYRRNETVGLWDKGLCVCTLLYDLIICQPI